MTEFPNFFRHQTQEEAALEVQQFWPLVQVNCSPELAFFLCSLYAPLCSTLDSPPPPCRSLCSRVKSGCLPILVKYGYAWPDSMACEKFPERLGDEVCLDRPSPKVVTAATQPPLRTEATGEGKLILMIHTLNEPTNEWIIEWMYTQLLTNKPTHRLPHLMTRSN